MAKPKPTNKLVQTGFRVSELKKKELEKVAKLRGQSLQSLIDEAVELRLSLTEGFWDQILRVAKKLKIDPSLVVANMIVKQASFEFTWLKVFGEPHPNFFNEFRFDAKGFVSGERLSEALLKEYEEKLSALKSKVEKISDSPKKEKNYEFSATEISALSLGQI